MSLQLLQGLHQPKFEQGPALWQSGGKSHNIAHKVKLLSVLLPTRRLFLPLLAAVATASPVGAVPRPIPASISTDSLAQVPTASSGNLALTLRRTNGSVEVVVQGTGAAPVLQQRSAAGIWQGQLNLPRSNGLRYGPQRISLPEAGLQSVSINGSGNSYQLEVTSTQGLPLGRPVVSADGINLVISFPAPVSSSPQSARLDLRQPGSVPQPTYAPPLQPRAVAPPLGDMAVGSMVLRNQGFINLRGPRVTLNLRRAKAIDALQLLARLGNYGFVFVDDQAVSRASGGKAAQSGNASSQAQGSATGSTGANVSLSVEAYGLDEGAPVTVSFVNEDYSRAINSVLMAANLQGKLDGNTLFAGPNVLGKTFGSQVSKVYRLNQASASSAADYLASLGASITKVTIITNAVTQGTTQASAVQGGPAAQQTQTQRITTTETYGGGVGPLKGLIGTTDSRLQTITLIGNSSIVSVAESYLRQIDLRQRQVALSVKILDVNLDNDSTLSNSFAMRWGNNFIVNDQGTLLGAFGTNLPPTSLQFQGLANGVISTPPVNPGGFYQKDNFYDFVKAQIVSSSTKILASPTLILQDNPTELRDGGSSRAGSSDTGALAAYDINSPIGRRRANEAVVRVGTNVVTNYETETPSQGGNVVCTPTLSTAGLVLGARVEKIDDNGFVTFALSPAVSAVTGREQAPDGCNTPLSILSIRTLDTGALRVRDGQTLIMTGVISDFDRAEVSKWPILGDIPLVGQFFRSSGRRREKRELVILVTPRIINDDSGGTYGYGYSPSTAETKSFLGGSTQPF